MFTNKTLENKTILVTGGGSGLGLSMASHYAKHGAKVAICGRNEEKLQKAIEKIRLEAPNSELIHHSVDVRDYDAVGDMFDLITAKFGAINGLLNNAAGNFLAASEDLSPNAFKSIIDIVLHGTFNCTQHFGKRLIASQLPGSVVNIVTTYAQTGSAFVLPSACAKAGVVALTNTLAMEWATYKIRLNSIAPGPFPTDGAWSRLLPSKDIEKAYLQKIPAGRYGNHEELANLSTFLMSDMANYITGDCITIDGGERLMAGQFNFFANQMPRQQIKGFFNLMKPSK